MPGTPAIVYEALESIPFFFTVPDADAAPSDSYSVPRSRITSSPGPPPDSPAAEYFFLDVAASPTADGAESPRRESVAPPSSSSRAAPNGNSSQRPAWLRSGGRFRSPMLQLHQEILEFCEFVSPTQEEQTKRDDAVQSVVDVIKYIWPQCKVEVFGSFKTGLYLPTSDIDVVILEANVRTPQLGLYALAKALSQKGIAKKTQVIAKARVPIIKFVEKQSGIAFDVSFDVDGGPKAAEFIKDAVKRIPPLRPLCLVLKAFLQQRDLNEIYWRGQDIRGRHEPGEHNLGILLVNFFDFYGRKLNTREVGVSCNLKGSFFLKSKKGFLNRQRPYLLSVEDPQAPENDIVKNSFNFDKVKSAFSLAYALLTDTKAMLDMDPDRSILGTIIRPDPALLELRGLKDSDPRFNSWLHLDTDLPVQLSAGTMYNWQLVGDDDDGPFPREVKTPGKDDGVLSKRKRSAKKEKQKPGERKVLKKWLDDKLKQANPFGDGDGSGSGRGSKSRRVEKSSRRSRTVEV